jgi:molybdopterin-containing oxidoreductase family iron-sulfur binding subunit
VERRRIWSRLAQWARDPRGADDRAREFAPGADEPPDGVVRRDFLRLVGASAALAGASGCKRAVRESLTAPVIQPEQAPGTSSWFATAIEIDGYARGVLARSDSGRPTKIEGNPDHPSSLGATGVIEQATLFSLYDPDRAASVSHRGAPASWRTFLERAAALATNRGRGVALLMAPTGSPTIGDQVARLRARLPEMDVRWHAPLAPRAAWEGARVALGKPLETRVDLKKADVVLALDADFVAAGPDALRLARDLAARRTPREAGDPMARLYAVEPTPSPTGLAADHRLRVRARDVLAVAAAVAIELAGAGVPVPDALRPALGAWARRASAHGAWTKAVARDLASRRGACAILVGETQPAELHALAHGMNAALGNVGTTIAYAASPLLDAGGDAFDLAPIARRLHAGEIDALVVLGGDPAYGAPADLDFGHAIARAKESLYLGPYVNATAEAAAWAAPQAHVLESWLDARAVDGTTTIVQPIVAPLVGDAHVATEVLAAMLGEGARDPHDMVASYWRRARATGDIDAWLERGVVEGTAIAPIEPPAPSWDAIRDALARRPAAAEGPSLEIALRRDSRVHDGSLANNPWAQELPDPVTRLTWDNAALLSRATASRLAVTDGDVVHLEIQGRSIRAPALVVPGHADETITVSLGYGKAASGESVARGVGADAYRLQTTSAMWFSDGLLATAVGERHELAVMQVTDGLYGRDEEIAHERTRDEWARAGEASAARAKRPLTLYDVGGHAPQQWGMVIDLSACTGCGACVVACQAENNVPTVGKAGVAKGRAMHWLRVDRYFVGPRDDPRAVLQPMLCQHCEKAPCEYVCPVNATTHSEDGLNQMIYNRCVGTRFCSNNCPYKVRRFNWFDYHQSEASVVALVHNPDVTVRARGVMEKCTYCVQRIREAQIRAQVTHAPMRDGDVETACEQACASRAITFGDVADRGSRVSKLRESSRMFACLEDLGTVPRTRYLARIRNPNPELGET